MYHISKGLPNSQIENLYLEDVSCDLVHRIPYNISGGVRYCTRAVSICPPEWSDEYIRMRCNSYQDACFGEDNIFYKNPYCSFCWNDTSMNLTNLHRPPLKSPMFRTFLDWNNIGLSKCSRKDSDKFKRNCQNLSRGTDSK